MSNLTKELTVSGPRGLTDAELDVVAGGKRINLPVCPNDHAIIKSPVIDIENGTDCFLEVPPVAHMG
jgi:hypothetical protein